MQKKILNTNKEDCLKIWDLDTINQQKSQELKLHSQRVLHLCERIIYYLEEKFDYKFKHKEKELIYRAAIFHDIAKIKYKDNHHKEAKKILTEYFENDKNLKKVCKIIRYHKGEFCPDKDLAMTSAILRMADKIDKINKGKYADFQKKYEKSTKKIKRHFKYNDIKGRKNLQKVCEMVVEEVKESLE